jgi:prolyl oligopeptidase
MKRQICTAGLAAVVLAAAASAGGPGYPATKKAVVTDEYFGTEVADPYRWLENDVREDEDVAAWVDAQNEVTFEYLSTLGDRGAIKDRLTDLWNYERYSAPSKVADYYVFSKNDGLQNQSVIYIQDDLDAEPRVLIDPNEWSTEGIVALAGTAFSESGDYLAFGKSKAGSDWRTWHVMNVRTGEILPDVIDWTKFGGVSWTHDDRGFFYSRYPAPEEGEAFQSLNLNMSIWYHRLGTPQSEDVLVHAEPDHPEWNFYGFVTEDGRYLVIYCSIGTDDRNRLYVKDLADPYGMPIPVIDNFDNKWNPFANDGSYFYFQTDLDAPNDRVVAFDIHDGPETLVEIIPERDETLQAAYMTGNMIVCSYLKDVLPLVKMHRPDGTHVRDVEFPGIGSGGGFGGKRTQTETFYSFSSFNRPPSIYRYDMITGESELFRSADVAFNPDDYVVKQVFFSSKDGTRVPMFISHKKGVELDGSNPTLLYGYGGFSISLTPYFSVTRLAWMEMGGVYAHANLRGGGEYGKAWHDAGKKLNKQNVFDDFIAAAEWLIDSGYTSPEKLAIMGGSNGGLLVGACMAQRPDLFAAALPAVGVMDMLRFHKFTAGRYWTDDYGSSEESPEMFRYLLGYSPYHNLEPGTEYPATMVTTADTDDRVVPGHSFKFAARLQECHVGDNPVLIRIQTDAGHGAGKPTDKVIEEYADMWAFLAKNLGMEPYLR